MKIKNNFLKAVSVILSIVFVVISSITIFAAGPVVNFIVSPMAYSVDRADYVSQDTFKSDEIVYLKVAATQISGLGGMAFTIDFDVNNLTFLKNKSVCAIDDSSGDTQYFLNEEKGVLKVTYDSGAYNVNSSFSGAAYYIAFKVNPLTSNVTVPISFNITDLYDNTFSQNNIESNVTAATTVYLVTETISDETLKLFQKLENIKYPDSKEDIDAAFEKYNMFTAAQKKFLKERYPSEYEWLSSANKRYNALAQKASEDAILSEVSNFKKDHKKALGLTAKTVKISDETAVNSANKSYENCSSAAKTRLQNEGKLLKELAERIETLKEIQTEIDDFLSNDAMQILWNDKILDYSFNSTYKEYLPAIQLALTTYDLLSDEAKAALKNEYEWVKKLDKEAQKYLALDEEAEKLAEEMAAFQANYVKVFMLNQNSVTEADRTAIEMVIAAYDALENEALKEALKPRIDGFKKMLTILDELAKNEPEKETVYVEVEGETITQTVQIPGETITQTQTEYITDTQYVPQAQTLTNKIVKLLNQKNGLGDIVLVLLILLTVSSGVLAATYFVCEIYKRRMAAFAVNDEEADL